MLHQSGQRLYGTLLRFLPVQVASTAFDQVCQKFQRYSSLNSHEDTGSLFKDLFRILIESKIDR